MVNPLTLIEAQSLRAGQILYEISSGLIFTVTSVRTWKREPNRVTVRLKRGKKYYEIDAGDLHEVSLTEPD